MDWILDSWPAIASLAAALGLTKSSWWPTLVKTLEAIRDHAPPLASKNALAIAAILFATWWGAGRPLPRFLQHVSFELSVAVDRPTDEFLAARCADLGAGLTPEQRQRVASVYLALADVIDRDGRGSGEREISTAALARTLHVKASNLAFQATDVPMAVSEKADDVLKGYLGLESGPLNAESAGRLSAAFRGIAWGVLQ